MRLDQRDTSILTQVAFKEATRFYDGTDESVPAFVNALSVLTDALLAQVNVTTNEHVQAAAASPAPQQSYNPEQGLADAMGATPEGATLEVVTTKFGGQEGPIPAWAFKAAAEKGVTKVFDNRGRIQRGEVSAKSPWFKDAAKGSDIGLWPPK